eukprot:6203238-Pleurochrysis_carterae.AAC.1
MGGGEARKFPPKICLGKILSYLPEGSRDCALSHARTKAPASSTNTLGLPPRHHPLEQTRARWFATSWNRRGGRIQMDM